MLPFRLCCCCFAAIHCKFTIFRYEFTFLVFFLFDFLFFFASFSSIQRLPAAIAFVAVHFVFVLLLLQYHFGTQLTLLGRKKFARITVVMLLYYACCCLCGWRLLLLFLSVCLFVCAVVLPTFGTHKCNNPY